MTQTYKFGRYEMTAEELDEMQTIVERRLYPTIEALRNDIVHTGLDKFPESVAEAKKVDNVETVAKEVTKFAMTMHAALLKMAGRLETSMIVAGMSSEEIQQMRDYGLYKGVQEGSATYKKVVAEAVTGHAIANLIQDVKKAFDA